MKDKNGKIISIGDSVDVPKPNKSDMHNFEFRGTVYSFEDELVIVVDGDDEYFNIEPERLEVADEDAERKFIYDNLKKFNAIKFKK